MVFHFWKDVLVVRVEEFDYPLPEELIAQHPIPNRDQSRLMVVNPVTKTFRHTTFNQINLELSAGDVLVLNNSKVLPARLHGQKSTGGHVEIMLHKRLGDFEWEALCRPAKRLKVGAVVHFDGGVQATVVEVFDEGLRRVRFDLQESMEAFLNRVGEMPLPPYIHEKLTDPNRYQTVYAKSEGSVAAPTAGLHFSPELLDGLKQSGVEVVEVTLHVGLGTFRPVQVEDVTAHHMHSEWYEITEEAAAIINAARLNGRRIVAVGTTALRTLESAASDGEVQPGSRDTSIFIYPGYEFQIVDALITNFHLPKSTLFMLVSAMMGTEFAKAVYAEAVAERYRFFSFGDAMLISRRITSGS